ncbi:MAG: dTDP-glucose 4,6-dehydratase [Woeseia sp.]
MGNTREVDKNTIVVTGGAGFIGSCFVRHIIKETRLSVINIDKLTYAGNLQSLASVEFNPRHMLVHGDISDSSVIEQVLDEYSPIAIVNLAAETHVDRSIDGAAPFIQSNIVGTFVMLEQSLRYWASLGASAKRDFRFVHVSTDEVFGTLGETGRFTEASSYAPNSPYSASKASSDHLVRAWHHTYGLPALISNCSNNFGPFQFPEKLIPLVIINALSGKALPVYGDGRNVRDWLYVEDHVRALVQILRNGAPGKTYVIGGDNEKTTLDVINAICDILDTTTSLEKNGSYRNLIRFVTDRPGHDYRYSVDSSLIQKELGWQPAESFESGLKQTIEWYIDNRQWWQNIFDNTYKLDRLGLFKYSERS